MKHPSATIVELGKALFILKREKNELDEKLKQLGARIKEIEEKELAQRMSELELTRFTVDGFGTLHIEDVFYANMLAENRDKVHQWLRDNGFGDLIKDYVFPGTLKAFAKEQIAKNQPLPNEIKISVVPTVRTLPAR